ncbi:MAG: hypothetical protein JNN27_13255 [Planctomycetes bacterium]|nr:hypothetical protein [Planctomycetota bacterium]
MLSDDLSLGALFNGFSSVYLDISGLPHHVWGPILRATFAKLETVRAVYVEPEVYRKHPSPTSRTEFDLSDGLRGVAPLPGFARLIGPEDGGQAVLVALLGFEGRRASLIAASLDPLPPVYALIGVPGFQVDYAQIAHASNEDFLLEARAHENIRYAAASCPFELFDALDAIWRDARRPYMFVAPIGTKPHSLGAICYALKNPEHTELLYDHPRRKPGRTHGIGPSHIYTLKPSYVAP